jgi:GTP-binding protein HflX
MLFATLDTTTRKISLPDGQALLLTDTVGFIRNLPHRLVEAFKSTLEEAVLADFLIQVVDVSDPDAYRHFETTLEVLAELGAVDKPMVVVFNKLDKLEESVRCETAETLARKMQMPTVSMSVRESWGMDDFMEACVEMLSHRVHTSIYKIPQYRSDLVAVMHREGKVLSTEYEENDIIVQAILPRALDSKLDDWKV